MHRQRRWAAAAAFVTMAASAAAGAPVAGAAASGATLYVDNTVSACSDAGSGTAATPYCNVQAAFSAVAAGDTVVIVAGNYTIPATLSASGTADAPITVWFGTPGSAFSLSSGPTLRGTSAPALSLTNASYVDIDNANVSGGSAAAVSVTGSSHVAFAGGQIAGSTTGLAVSGASSDVSATRVELTGGTSAVSIGSGVTGTVIATDEISSSAGDAVDVDGASGSDIVGNGVSACDDSVSVSGGATGTTIENNVIQPGYSGPTGCAAPVGLDVDADSSAGTTEKYDTIIAFQGTPVEWAGTAYTAAADYQAASGQGAQDIIRIAGYGEGPSDYVDNADALAPGETSTDFYGAPREDDPYVANTGTGVGYYDRGPLEETDRFASQILDVEPVSGTANQYDLLWGYESGWELCPENYTTTVNWGDGTSSTYTGTSCATASAKASKKPSLIGPYCIYTQCFDADHTYTRPGAYNVTFTATDGTVTVNDSTSITTSSADYSAYGPTRIPDTRKGIGAAKAAVKQGSYVKLKVAGNGWIAAVPDGAPAPTTSILNYLTGQTISNTVIVPVGADGRIRLYNGGSTTPVDLIADVAGYFSADAPNAYEPLAAADRAVDTRRSGNTALQPTSSSHFWLPGNLNIVAVIGNMTVTQPSANGFVTAYPDGVTQPSVSNVNFLTGQTVANLAILNTNTSENPATNVYNSSNGTTELIIDVFGYFGS